MKRKVCFLFINATITEPQRMVMDLGQGEMIVVGVGSYDMACSEAKKLAEEMGGRIWAESEGKGKGSIFKIALPLAPQG